MDPQAVDSARKSHEIARHAQEQIRRMLARSAVDMEFRRTLLSDPMAALEEATGMTPPASLRLRFIESLGYTTIVLPDPVVPAGQSPGSDAAEPDLRDGGGAPWPGTEGAPPRP